MKVALIAAPFVEVPPKKYGGHERVLNSLSKNLVSNGVDVTLFASGDSESSVPIRNICDIALFNDESYDHSVDRNSRCREINDVTISLIEGDTDIINCHDYDNPDLIERLSTLGIPVLVTLGHSINQVIQGIYDSSKDKKNITFHGLSKSQLGSLNGGENLPVVYNGVPVLEDFLRTPKRVFLSLGDTKPIKGHNTAIKLAKESDLELIIAGSPVYPESEIYFNESVKPYIDLDYSENKGYFLESLSNGYVPKKGRIVYLGSVNDKDKEVLFRNVAFTQFLGGLEVKGNIEACPLVPIESTIHGTPVLGVRGSVTDELIRDYVNGFNVSSLDEAFEKVEDFIALDFEKVRSFGVQRFSESSMARSYISLYEKIIGGEYGR